MKNMSKKQLYLLFIPFIGSMVFIHCERIRRGIRFYEVYKISKFLLPSIIVTIILGAIFGIIGLFAYAVAAIICLIIMGIVWNFLFFKFYNKHNPCE